VRKKKFMVVPRTPKAREEGITTSRGKRQFNRGAFFVSEPSEAEEIDARYGLKGKKGDVWVHEDPVYEWSLHHDMSVKGHNILIHRNTFTGIDHSRPGGNERVRVKTADGYTIVSRAVAIEEGLLIISKQRKSPRHRDETPTRRTKQRQ
jgi:hypothetical protein